MKKYFSPFLLSFTCLLGVSDAGAQASTYWHDRIDTTIYATTTGTDTYTGTNLNPNFNVARYNNGLMVSTIIVNANTGASTYQLVTATGTLASRAILKQNGAALAAGDIPDSSAVLLIYYGTFWRLVGIHVSDGDFWALTGNAGTSPGTNYVGTSDGQNLQLRTNNTLALTVNTSQNLFASNRLSVGADKFTATIGGVSYDVRVAAWGDGVEGGLTLGSATGTGAVGANILGVRSRGTTASPTVVSSGDNLLDMIGHGYDGTDFEPGGGVYIESDGTPGANDMPGRIVFKTTPDGSADDTERVRITNAGLVGIGTSAPISWLDVKKSADSDTLFRVSNDVSGSDSTFIILPNGRVGIGTNGPTAKVHIIGSGATSATYGLQVHNSTGISNSLVVRDDARVGIGTSAPDNPLHISAANSIPLKLQNTAGATSCYTDFNTTTYRTVAGIGQASGNAFEVYDYTAGGIYLMQIKTSTQNVHFENALTGSHYIYGKNSGGEFYIGNASSAGAIFTGALAYATVLGTTVATRAVQFATQNTVRMTIDSVGLVGVGTTSPLHRLHVSGGALAWDSSLVDIGKTIDVTAGDAATIHASSGRFRKDATGTTFTLTNSQITANSIIILTYASDPGVTGFDSYVVAGAGSAVITFTTSGVAAAPTNETDVNFLIIN